MIVGMLRKLSSRRIRWLIFEFPFLQLDEVQCCSGVQFFPGWYNKAWNPYLKGSVTRHLESMHWEKCRWYCTYQLTGLYGVLWKTRISVSNQLLSGTYGPRNIDFIIVICFKCRISTSVFSQSAENRSPVAAQDADRPPIPRWLAEDKFDKELVNRY